MSQNNIVQVIWGLCHILRGDGITFYHYISELSYLLFLKIAQENGSEELLPLGYRWADLEQHDEKGLLGFYREMLTHLGEASESEVVKAIYAFPTTVFSHSENLKAIVDTVSKLEWHQVGRDGFGELYSGLIDKSARDTRSGAGQYFTPRPIIETMIFLTKPALGETIQDPAVGSGGFLVAADSYIRHNESEKHYESNPPNYQGVEIEKNTRRICLMNTFLHGLDANIIYGDALTNDAEELEPADLILANPPFGNKAGSRRALRTDLPYPHSNKQLAFLQHIYLGLRDGGRAAVVVPDNILFESGIGQTIRHDLMQLCDLHTILRLPSGVFYAPGVKTNVLFFSRCNSIDVTTRGVWVYDMRTNMPRYGKTARIERQHFDNFIECFGEDPKGHSQRIDQGSTGRFRFFDREYIERRNENLDITWLRDDRIESKDELADIEDISDAILEHLRSALSEVQCVADELASAIGDKE